MEPNPSKECAICHYNWVDVFYREGKSTDLAEYPKEKQAAAEMMCYSCHDGSVNDSRFKVWETNRHKPGTKPSEGIEIPLSFPLDKDGKMQCFTCHSAHGVDTRPGIEATIFLRASNKNSSMCRMCHKDKGRGPKIGSHPVDVVFNVPEIITKAGGKTGSKGEVICQTCHSPHGSTSEHFLVMPNSGKGLTHSALCEACHTKSPDIVAKSPLRFNSHPVDVTITKEAKLPEKWQNGETPYLSFDNRINCRTCHSPHNATNNNHLLVEKNEKGGICLYCHSSQSVVAKSKHNMEMTAPEAKNIDGFMVSDKGICSACHMMHKGTGPKMWARDMGEGNDPMQKMCASCHSENGIAKKKLVGKETHPVGVDVKTLGIKTALPLYDGRGKKSGNQDEGMVVCSTCHNVHQWDPNAPQKISQRDEEGNASNSFLRISSGAKNEICAACHQDKFDIQDTKHYTSLIAKNSKNIKGEAMSESGPCGGCHLPHNGSGIRIWARKEMGSEKDPAANLCLGCHKKSGIAGNSEVRLENSHPVGVHIANTGIKDEDGAWRSIYMNVLKGGVLSVPEMKRLPLFDEEGKKVKNGNVSCATCHDPHKWKPKGTNERSAQKQDESGEGTSSFLRIANGPNSELCANCHITKRPVIFTKHNLNNFSPSEKNVVGKTAAAGGVCSACHVSHNAAGPMLWAKKTGSSNDVSQSLCESCHMKGGAAEKKAAGEHSHPVGTQIKPYMKETTLPLYTLQGKKDRKDGMLVCATCHDPHQWDPDDVSSFSGQGGQGGQGKDVEGNAANSFLRMSAAPDPILCANCHQDKKYVFNTEHDMRVAAKDAKNFKGQTIGQSGVCGQCHFVHNSKEETLLWARELGTGQDKMEMLCRSCHSDNRIAGDKQPVKFIHPSDVVIVSPAAKSKDAKKGGYFPLYSQDGKKKETGYITCPTCHNPHQWSAIKQDYGPGKNIEGNAVNSFLRNKSESALCTDCHGMDALFRYKNYHGETSRKPYPISVP
ncbi:MAG: cytochrome c3 family protein [Deltaproteobacteria bacterium]|nr:cytochrome c3 family protein [Deltaproteobacteria bacterium]